MVLPDCLRQCNDSSTLAKGFSQASRSPYLCLSYLEIAVNWFNKRGRIAKCLLASLSLVVLVCGCSEPVAEKTTDPVQVEESRKKHEQMSNLERGS